MRRGDLRRSTAAALLVLLALLAPAADAAAAPRRARQDAPGLALARQTSSVAPGGAMDLVVVGPDLVAGATVTVRVHDRVRSRTELTTSAARTDLRRPLRQTTVPVDALAVEADGARRLTLDLADTAARNEAVTVPGVYPVTVDVDDRPAFVTHLVVHPPEPTGPPLAVAVLATVDGASLDDRDSTAAAAMVGALNAAPDVEATLALRPEAIDPLTSAAEDSPGASLLSALRAASGRAHLGLPYAPVSPDALVTSGIRDELGHHLAHGNATVLAATGATPSSVTWIAGPGLGAGGLALLADQGVHHLLLEADQVESVGDGVLSLARPFRVVGPRSERSGSAGASAAPVIDALVRDERLAASLATEGPPALVASRTLAELASLWFEQEDVARAVVVPVDPSLDPAVLATLLAGLRGTPTFRAVSVDDAFTSATPLLTRGGAPVERALARDAGSPVGASVAASIHTARTLRTSVASMVGPSAPLLRAIDAHLLRASSDRLDDRQRRQELAALRSTVDDLTSGITTPERFTITLTARSGTVPLNVRNDTGVPVELRVRLRSSKLDLPEGDTFTLRLDEETTRHDIAVRTRASGSFEVEVELTSPDGAIDVSTTRFSVRSTAVSGVGLVLSLGAGCFLVVWWARHWREARRSAKLVDSAHPVHRPPS